MLWVRVPPEQLFFSFPMEKEMFRLNWLYYLALIHLSRSNSFHVAIETYLHSIALWPSTNILHSLYCTHYTALTILHSLYCTHYTALTILHSLYCTHYTALTILHSLYCTHYTALTILYTILHSLYCTHYTVHYTALTILHSLYCTLFNFLSHCGCTFSKTLWLLYFFYV